MPIDDPSVPSSGSGAGPIPSSGPGPEPGPASGPEVHGGRTRTPILEIEDLSIGVRGASGPLVEPLSLTIARGERVGLIGESGSGKSLTASAVMGLLAPELTAAGSVRVDGREVLGRGERELAPLRGSTMSMVFQEPMSALDPLMRVGAQLAEVLRLHARIPAAQARARAVEKLAEVHLPDPATLARAYPHQLSGGQRQRVLLAMAMANSPDLLICDEPTTALDVTVQARMLALIDEEVTRQDAGLLFITHDLAVVAGLCERVLVMREGRVVEQGSTREVFRNPRHPYTQGLLEASDLSGRRTPRPRTVVGETNRAAESGPGTVARSPEATRPGPAPDPLIEVSGLSRSFIRPRNTLFGPAPRVQALDSVSFTVERGERFGIVGESGSGKSTLLKLLAGLDRPTAGHLAVDGISLESAGRTDLRRLRDRLSLVFQDPYASLDPRMRIAEILTEPLRPRKVAGSELADRIAAAIEDVGLDTGMLDRYPHQFSGGQRQRISIARALIGRPSVLVADEPVSALDVSVRARVLDLIGGLVDEHDLTLVFVSHDMSVVRHLCSRLVVMREGRIVESGDTESIYTRPQEQYTAELIAATPRLETALG